MEPAIIQDLVLTYSQLSEEEQSRVLCSLSVQLTIHARAAYQLEVPDDAESFRILRTFNELQHQIAQQLCHILHHRTQRYPDDVFISIIVEKGGSLIMTNLPKAIRQALRAS